MSGLSAYTGLQRSGKSYNAVKRVIAPAVSRGREVWTNIPLNIDAFDALHSGNENYVRPTNFTADDILSNPNFFYEVLPKGVVFVLDECHMIFPAGKKANQFTEQEKEFITQYSHLVNDKGFTTEFVIVTQDLANVASFVRNLVGVTYRHSKLLSVGLDRYKVQICSGSVAGAKVPATQLLRTDGPLKYEPKIYNLYKSSTKADVGTVGDERKQDDRINIFKSPKFIAGIILVPLIFAFGLYYSYNSFANFGVTESETDNFDVNESSSEPYFLPASDVSNQIPSNFGPQIDFDFSNIFISMNNGLGLRTQYRFTYDDGVNVSYYENYHLSKIGIVVEPINKCSVFMTFQNQTYLIRCRKFNYDNENNNSVLPFLG